MYPVSIQALKLSISFWLHMLNSGENSLVSTAYKSSLLLPNGFDKNLGKSEHIYKTAALTAALFTPIKNLANLI
jgi:hypothetical protein